MSTLFILIGFSTWMMLPIRANANTAINENKPSDAAEVLAYYNREQYGEQKLFYGPQFSDTYSGLDEDNPYLDESPNYERDYKTGKYIITNNYKNAKQNTDDNQKAFLPRLWSTEHIENYMNFTNVPEFKIKPEYLEEKELVDIISEFRKAYAAKDIDNEGYDLVFKKLWRIFNYRQTNYLRQFKFHVSISIWLYVLEIFDVEFRWKTKRCSRKI